jgi:DNA-binding GntR family transcriptional regulator
MKDDDRLPMTVVATPLRQQVADAIRSAIVSGRFQLGQRLVEKDLCELLGVSRVSVREALRQLETEGFIDTVPHRGPVVIQLTAKDVRNLYDVLSILEAQGARLFAQHASDEEMEAFDQAVKNIVKVYKKGSTEDRLAAKLRFYQVMFTGARNAVLESAFRTVYGRITIVLRMALASSKNLEDVARAIEKMAIAVRRRDADEVFDRARRMVEEAGTETLRQLSSALARPEQGGNPAALKPVRTGSKRLRRAGA